MASGHILKEVKDGVATVTLNRPEKLNAFSGTMAAELYASFAEYDKDDDVRVIVVTGAGRAFSAGADLSGGGNTFDADARGASRSARAGDQAMERAQADYRGDHAPRSGWASRCRCNGTSGSRPRARESASCSCAAELSRKRSACGPCRE